MAAILHDPLGYADPLVLEEGVAWTFSGTGDFDLEAVAWHRMLVSGVDGRFAVQDELDTTGYCCDHCNGYMDVTPSAMVNEVRTNRGWIRGGDTLGFGERRWRVELRRGALSPLRDLFRVSAPAEPLPFHSLLDRFQVAVDPAGAGGLLRFAHLQRHHVRLVQVLTGALPRVKNADADCRTGAYALAIGLVRQNALPRSAAEFILKDVASDSSLDRWLHISALAVLALDESATRRANELRLLVLAALEEGDAPAAVVQGCETLALVLEEDPLRSLGEAARAVVSDASARKRRTIAVAVLAALSERDPECARAVIRAASDPHEQVRAAAARALVRLPSAHVRSADAALLRLLGDPDDDVFEEAFAALFGSQPPRVPPEAVLGEVDRAVGDPARLARLTLALDRLA